MMKITHSAFHQPLSLWSRNRSANTMNSSQIQMKKRANQRSEKKTWPTCQSASTIV